MCFIFPNKRAVGFFLKYLGDLSAAQRRPIIAPACITINDFFARLGGLRPADRMAAMLTLYDCYKALKPDAEPLDEFIFWGGVILSDFAEVDKYLVEPGHIFKNVAEYRQLQDSLDYLTAEQEEALRHFLGQFRDSGEYKERFRRIWDILLPLYHSFNEALAAEGMATEGAIYRSIAKSLDSVAVVDLLGEGFPDTERFVFVGLNALNECEKRVMRRMRDAGVAEFCWDFSSEEIKDGANRASFFLSRNVAEFPQAFVPDPDGLPRPVVNVVSVPSSVGQTKLLPSILSGVCIPPSGVRPSGSPHHPFGTVPPLSNRGCYVPQGECTQPDSSNSLDAIGINTAIVLPDEGLLMNVLNSVPEGVEDVNVTMGYPIKGSEFQALMDDIAAMQQNLRERNGQVQFYHKYVWGIFSNGIIRDCLSEDGKQIVGKIRKDARYFIGRDAFRGDALLELIFRPAEDIPQYLKELLIGIAPLLKEQGHMQMELDFAMFYYKAANRLEGMHLEIQPRTMWRLLGQLTARASVPFKGEPLKGLQIMGPLETRALDFDNLIILSCNEGMFPRRSVAPSFIPAELRKGFGLPTYEYQDSVWAYYFYRLIQRASNVWLLFDSRTELSRSGEESRYIRQLQMLYDFDLRRYVVKAPLQDAAAAADIEKTDGDLGAMQADGFSLSVSALQNYLSCPAKFYYSKVKGLKAADEVSEALDAGMLGTVLHETMQTLYGADKIISKAYLEKLLSDEPYLRGLVASGIKEKLKTDEVEGRNLIFEEVIVKYVLQILKTDLARLKKAGKESFRVLGLELERWKTIGGFRFKGYIDRLDSFEDGTVRIVDYKTGKVLDTDVKISDDNASSVVDSLFEAKENSKRPKIALQLYLYDEYLEGDPLIKGKKIVNCIYQTSNIFVSMPEEVERSRQFCQLMRERVAGMLDEIRDKSVPWSRTKDIKTCEFCDFKTICGR
jgi:CRISPR/Cas system-associated exonuclease Cas4 (RecB family)